MAATKVHFDSKLKLSGSDEEIFIFETDNSQFLWVKSFKGNTVTLEVPGGEELTRFARVVSGCFIPESNFEDQMMYHYGNARPVNRIQFVFNGVPVTVEKEDPSASKIIADWRAGWDTMSKKAKNK